MQSVLMKATIAQDNTGKKSQISKLYFTCILLIIQTWKKCNFSNFGSLFGFWSNQNWKIAENQTRELNNPGSETFLMNLDFL